MATLTLEQALEDIIDTPVHIGKNSYQLEQRASNLVNGYDISDWLKGCKKTIKSAYNCSKSKYKRFANTLDKTIKKHLEYNVGLYKRDVLFAVGYGVSAFSLAYFNRNLPIVNNLTDSLGYIVHNPNFGEGVKEMASSIGAFTTIFMSANIYDDDLRGFVQSLGVATIAYNFGLQITDAIPIIDKYVDTLSYASVLGACINTFRKGVRLIV